MLSCQHSKATIQSHLHDTLTSRMRHTDSNFSLKWLHCIATIQLRLHSTPIFKLRDTVNSLTKDSTAQLQSSMFTQYIHLTLRNRERQKTPPHRSNILQSTPTSKLRDTDSNFSYKRLHCLATIYCTAHPPLNWETLTVNSCQHSKATIQSHLYGTPTPKLRHTILLQKTPLRSYNLVTSTQHTHL